LKGPRIVTGVSFWKIDEGSIIFAVLGCSDFYQRGVGLSLCGFKSLLASGHLLWLIMGEPSIAGSPNFNAGGNDTTLLLFDLRYYLHLVDRLGC
jgi:hypothetical protein